MDSYRRKDDDRGREHRLVSTPPSLRTGRADLPHTALQSVVLPARGLTVQRMGVSYKLRGSRLAAPSASVLSGPAVRPALIGVRTLSDAPGPGAILSVSFRLDRTSRLHLP